MKSYVFKLLVVTALIVLAAIGTGRLLWNSIIGLVPQPLPVYIVVTQEVTSQLDTVSLTQETLETPEATQSHVDLGDTWVSHTPVDIAWWAEKSIMPPRIEYLSMECRPLRLFPDGVGVAEAEFYPVNGEFIVVTTPPSYLTLYIFTPESGSDVYIPDDSVGVLWGCGRVDYVRLMINLSMQVTTYGKGASLYGYPDLTVYDKDLCSIDDLQYNLESFVGQRLVVLDYGKKWVALLFDGEDVPRCFPYGLSDITTSDQLRFEGDSIDLERNVSFYHSGWWNRWSTPLGKAGILQQFTDGEFYVHGDQMTGTNDDTVITAWESWYPKLVDAVGDKYLTMRRLGIWNTVYSEEPGYKCSLMGEWAYLVPLPDSVSFCSTDSTRFGDYYTFEGWEYSFKTLVPTDAELASASFIWPAPYVIQQVYCDEPGETGDYYYNSVIVHLRRGEELGVANIYMSEDMVVLIRNARGDSIGFFKLPYALRACSFAEGEYDK